jgi:LCP family protein required for cell wall assembly
VSPAPEGLAQLGSETIGSIPVICAKRAVSGWVSRHKAVTGLILCALLLVGMAGGAYVWVDHKIGEIPRVDLGLPDADDESDSGDQGAPGKAVNILMLGTDSRDQEALERMVESGWEPGAMRSDTIMVLHVSADRDEASLVSIPRDTWTDVPGYGPNKINAAFSYGGPKLALDTVREFTGIGIDHVAIVDWDGFKDITTAIGGVDVQVPENITSSSGRLLWVRGTTHLVGVEALAYVRQRHDLPNGDFDRVARQQNFLRAVMSKMLSSGSVTNPVRLVKTLNATVPNLTVDASLDNGRVRDLAFSMRGLRTSDVTFATVPLDSYATRGGGQSVVLVDQALVRDMFEAADDDELQEFMKREGVAGLPGPGSVS